MKDAIADDKIALAAYSKGDATVPLRTNIDIKPDNGQSLYMPGYAAVKEPALGVKIVSVYLITLIRVFLAFPQQWLV